MSSYYYAKKREAEPTAREMHDAVLREKIMEVWSGRKGRKVYGARKIWLELNSQGIQEHYSKLAHWSAFGLSTTS